jgi:hypothetical protein
MVEPAFPSTTDKSRPQLAMATSCTPLETPNLFGLDYSNIDGDRSTGISVAQLRWHEPDHWLIGRMVWHHAMDCGHVLVSPEQDERMISHRSPLIPGRRNSTTTALAGHGFGINRCRVGWFKDHTEYCERNIDGPSVNWRLEEDSLLRSFLRKSSLSKKASRSFDPR